MANDCGVVSEKARLIVAMPVNRSFNRHDKFIPAHEPTF